MSLQTENLSDWIQTYKWDYFLTVTNRHPRTDPLAFMRDVWDELTTSENKFWSNPDLINLPGRSFIACEPHKFSHNLHAHALLSGGPGLYAPQVINKAMEHRFGYSRTEVCRSKAQVSSYCAKYVTKWGNGDNYDYFGNWLTPDV